MLSIVIHASLAVLAVYRMDFFLKLNLFSTAFHDWSFFGLDALARSSLFRSVAMLTVTR